MISKLVAIEFVKHRKGLLPAVLTSYLVATFLLSFYLPHLAQRGQLVVLVKLFAGTFIPLLMSISIIQTVQPDRVAGNFMLTTHLTNPYFDWGEMQVVTHWAIHSVLAVTSYSILSHLTHVTINWLPLVYTQLTDGRADYLSTIAQPKFCNCLFSCCRCDHVCANR